MAHNYDILFAGGSSGVEVFDLRSDTIMSSLKRWWGFMLDQRVKGPVFCKNSLKDH